MRRDLCSKMYALDPACHKNEGDDDQGASLSAAGGSLIHRGRSGVGRQLTYPTPGSDETEGDGVEQTGRGSYLSVCLFQFVCVCLCLSLSLSGFLSVRRGWRGATVITGDWVGWALGEGVTCHCFHPAWKIVH